MTSLAYRGDALPCTFVEVLLIAAFNSTFNSSVAFCRYFLSGVDVNAVDYDGRSALHVAAAEGHTDVIRFLLENAGANAALRDR